MSDCGFFNLHSGLVVESWESQLEGLSALTFQVLTIEQKPSGTALEPFAFAM
jgi:hypothetical protein